ncbi:MBL fold metallo-hydrolase, partial [Desulfobacterales bacterium HSG17]|nr:MBL fold metallo-hydrolase [Desulfobacterales bacterium HSG17]
PENSFPIKLDDNIFMLGNYFFNLFLIVGNNRCALFEAGISAVVDSVIKQLETLGIEPDYIIPSHPHSDHITGLPGLVERYPKAQIIVAKESKEFIEHPKAAHLMFVEDKFMAKNLAKFNITPGRSSIEKIPDLNDSLAINKQNSLELGGITLDLIKVTGHSPGNLIGAIKKNKILFCSDSIGFHYPGRGYFPLFFTGADSYLSTMNFIKEFCPLIICPAHQGPLTGEKAIQGIQESYDLTVNTINMIQQSNLDDKTLADQLFKNGYKDEFTLYTPENIQNCCNLLIKRSKEFIKYE